MSGISNSYYYLGFRQASDSAIKLRRCHATLEIDLISFAFDLCGLGLSLHKVIQNRISPNQKVFLLCLCALSGGALAYRCVSQKNSFIDRIKNWWLREKHDEATVIGRQKASSQSPNSACNCYRKDVGRHKLRRRRRYRRGGHDYIPRYFMLVPQSSPVNMSSLAACNNKSSTFDSTSDMSCSSCFSKRRTRCSTSKPNISGIRMPPDGKERRSSRTPLSNSSISSFSSLSSVSGSMLDIVKEARQVRHMIREASFDSINLDFSTQNYSRYSLHNTPFQSETTPPISKHTMDRNAWRLTAPSNSNYICSDLASSEESMEWDNAECLNLQQLWDDGTNDILPPKSTADGELDLELVLNQDKSIMDYRYSLISSNSSRSLCSDESGFQESITSSSLSGDTGNQNTAKSQINLEY